MGLKEEIEKLDLADKPEPETPADEIEKLEDTVEGAEALSKEGPEKPAEEEPKVAARPEAPKIEQPADNSAWARMRYEASEAKREADRLKAELESLKKPQPVVPNKEENFAGYIEHELGSLKQALAETTEKLTTKEQAEQYETQRSQAMEEFEQIESSFKASTPDYEDVSRHAVTVIANSIRVLNPGISSQKLAKQTQDIILMRAANAARAGQNPAEALYIEAKSFGYQPKAPETPPAKEERRPSLAAVAENKKKSTGMATGGSSGSALPTNESVFNMTNAERSKLTPSDWERLEAEAS